MTLASAKAELHYLSRGGSARSEFVRFCDSEHAKATPNMSAESQFSSGLPLPQSNTPLRDIIAAAIARRPDTSLRAIAQLVTDAGWELDKDQSSISVSTVHGWLNGAIPQPPVRRRIAHALNIARHDLDAAADRQRRIRRVHRHDPESHAGDRSGEVLHVSTSPPHLIEPQAGSEPVDSDGVKRRAFGLWLATAGAAFATMDLDRAAALLAGTRPDHAALDDMETLTRELVRREATLSPRSLFPAVQGHLQGMRDILLWTPASLGPRAYSLAGQTALLAGYLMLQQERKREADAYWELADRFADMSGDVRLRAALLVHQAWRWEEQDISRSIALLDRAHSILGPNPDPAMATMALSARAAHRAQVTASDAGNGTGAIRDMDSAQEQLNRMPTTDDRLYLFRSVTYQATELRADVFRHLGSHGDAAASYQAALASLDPSWHASRSWVTSGLAAAIAERGDPEYACDLFATSIQLAATVSPRSVRYIRDKYMEALAGYDGPAGRRLKDLIHTLELPE